MLGPEFGNLQQLIHVLVQSLFDGRLLLHLLSPKEGPQFFQLYEDSFPLFKTSYSKVVYQGDESPFWNSSTDTPLLPLYWQYIHYLEEPETFITDKASLMDSDVATIHELHDFTTKHMILKCKAMIKSRAIRRDETLGISN